MSEILNKNSVENPKYREVSEAVGAASFTMRKERFDDRRQRVEDGERWEDAYLYESDELYELYELAEQKSAEVLYAWEEFQDLLKQINEKRSELRLENRSRKIAADVFEKVDVAPPNETIS